MIEKDLGAVSAYAIAVAHGYVGTETQWLESLKGRDGVQLDPTLTDSAKAAPADKVGEIKTAIGGGTVTLYGETATRAKLNGAYVVNTYGKLSFVNTTTYYTNTPIDISGLEVGSKVYAFSNLTSQYGVFIADADMNVLYYINGTTASEKGYVANNSPQDVEITVPENAKYIVTDIRTAKYEERETDSFKFSGTAKLATDLLSDRIDGVDSRLTAVESEVFPDDTNPLAHIIKDGGEMKILKTIGVVGDSLASGAMSEPNDGLAEDLETTTDYTWYSWIQYISRSAGISGYNFSKGGLSARSLRYEPTNQYVAKILSDLAAYKCRAYFVALGHNDKNYAESHPEYVVDGAYDKANPNTNSDTFTGNYAWILSKIKSINPAAKIFCITMKIKSRFEAYNTAIRTLAEDFGAYLIDMEDVPLESAWEYSYGHGNAMGYLNYGNQIATYTDWIIRHNRADFKEVQFIPDNPIPTLGELNTSVIRHNEDIAELQTGKQDTLTAGDNITIVDNVISASGGGASGFRQINQFTVTEEQSSEKILTYNMSESAIDEIIILIEHSGSAGTNNYIKWYADSAQVAGGCYYDAGTAISSCRLTGLGKTFMAYQSLSTSNGYSVSIKANAVAGDISAINRFSVTANGSSGKHGAGTVITVFVK